MICYSLYQYATRAFKELAKDRKNSWYINTGISDQQENQKSHSQVTQKHKIQRQGKY